MAKSWLLFIGIALSCLVARAEPAGSIDASFQIGAGPNGSIQQVIPLADNKVLVRGSFSTWNGASVPGIVRLNVDGSVDGGFQLDAGVTQLSRAWVFEDGRILVSAQIRVGETLYALAWLGANGAIDRAIAAKPDGAVQVAEEVAGRMFMGGTFKAVDGALRLGIALLKADGTLDTSFVPEEGLSGAPRSIRILKGGSVLVAGLSFDTGGGSISGMVRLLPTGAVDRQFELGNASFFAKTIYPIANGNSILNSTFNLSRVLANDALDQHYTNVAASVFAEILAVQADERQLVGGTGVLDATGAASRLVRVFADGKIDPSFRTELIRTPSIVGIYPDGRIIAADDFAIYGTLKMVALFGNDEAAPTEVLWHASDVDAIHNGPVTMKVIRQGSLAGTSGVDWSAVAGDGMQITPTSGRVEFTAGQTWADVTVNVASANDATSSATFALANAQGAMLGTNVQLTLYVTNQTGVIELSAGSATMSEAQGLGSFSIVRSGALNRPAGVQWRIVGANPESDFSVASGTAHFEANQSSSAISVRLRDDTDVETNRTYQLQISSTDVDWPVGAQTNLNLTVLENDLPGFPGVAADGSIFFSRRLRDGSIVIVGNFEHVNGVERRGFARIQANGRLDETFQPQLSYSALSEISELADGSLMLIGSFAVARGEPNLSMVRLLANGEVDLSFHAPNLTTVSSVVGFDDGSYLLSGYQRMLGSRGGTNYGALARLSVTGEADTNFFTMTYGGGPNKLEMLPNGQFYVYGNIMAGTNYFFVGQTNPPPYRSGIVRFNSDGTVDPSFAVTVTITNTPFPRFPFENTSGALGPAGLYVYDDGRVLAGGSFSNINSRAVPGIARLTPSGELDLEFLTNTTRVLGTNAQVIDFALNGEGKILVWRLGPNQTGASFLILLNENGLAEAFVTVSGGNAAGDIHAMPDGSFVVTGSFTQIATQPRFRIARIEASGRLRQEPSVAVTGISRSAGVTALRVYSSSNRTVRLQRNSELGNADGWSEVKAVALAGGEQTVEVADESETAFYRFVE